jgi:hypothetical protein
MLNPSYIGKVRPNTHFYKLPNNKALYYIGLFCFQEDTKRTYPQLIVDHTVILEYFNIKNKHFLIFLPVFLHIHRHPKQTEFFKCYDAFLRAALTGHGHPSPF